MKNVMLYIFIISFLASCAEADDEKLDTHLLIGNWQHINQTSQIQFDDNHNYIITFEKNTQTKMKFQLDQSADPHRIYIFDNKVRLECFYQLIGKDKLQLTPILPYDDAPTSTYIRQQ